MAHPEKESSFLVVGSGEEWFISVVSEALRALYVISEESNLEQAIRIGKTYAEGENEKEQISMIALLYRKEISGDLKPPPSLQTIYSQIAKEMDLEGQPSNVRP